jgi:hypothetical protein
VRRFGALNLFFLLALAACGADTRPSAPARAAATDPMERFVADCIGECYRAGKTISVCMPECSAKLDTFLHAKGAL